MQIPDRLSLFLASALVVTIPGCGEDDGTGDTDATTGMGTSNSNASSSGADSSDECTPGHESCICVDGNLCLGGLSCVSSVCVDLGDTTTTGGTTGGTTDTSTSTGKDSDTTSTTSTTGEPPNTCSNSSECATDEVCVGGSCGSTDLYYFNVYIERFDPPVCDDGFGTSELYYDYYQNDTYISKSTTETCPGQWETEALYYDSLQSFRVAFWEEDVFDDDFITSLCWGGDPCEPIPPELLHAGEWSGTDSSENYYMEFRFVPIED